MIHLFPAIYCEGPTDELFLSLLIGRLLRERTTQEQDEPVNVHPTLVVSKEKIGAGSGAERLVEAAKYAMNYHILFVHLDADAQALKEARKSRFEPGLNEIRALAETENLCRHLVPIIPEPMTETWMLADWKSVLAALDSEMPEAELRRKLKERECILPEKPSQAVSVREPKRVLEQIVKIAGRRSHALGGLYEPVSAQVSLKVLRQLKSFKRFESELTAKLIELRFIKN